MTIRSKAPLRLGLAGGGTDVSPYCDIYGGCVLNVTINLYAYCTIIPTNDGTIIFEAADINDLFPSQAKPFLDLKGTLLLHKATYNRIVKDYNINKPLSFKMITYSDAPPGSGLGSSSTLIVAMLKCYAEWLNLPLGEYDMAHLAYEIERVDVGLSGGKQDQYASTFGGFNFIEFLEGKRVIVNPLRIKRWIKNEIQNSLILYFTGTSRDSAKIIDEQIKGAEENKTDNVKAMHEVKRTAYQMKEAILKGDFDGLANCLRAGWEAKKKMANCITNNNIEILYNTIIGNGGKAAKISGAGGGGFMMILCDPVTRYSLTKILENTDGKVVTCEFTDVGTQGWTVY